ncbi:flavodoxin domain-containing protein [Streptomyces sp. S.PB5]|uniref:flavodoxin family protein n=1 Tax=Streptomyces sp. S.PB5 TaxID=3020844 RepID=UPI0025B00048|nr:flavodoxin domain-containing protein [Streptomyces sp. S.PB5]MDN3029296.1 NAD(P)H dehydrogenase [Streptomyces sp. S.PB5]
MSEALKPNVAVVYYSSTGTVHQLAETIGTGASEAGAEVRLLRVDELAPKEVIANVQPWADHTAATAHIPVATLASQLHGGQESTLLALCNSTYYFGGFVVPPGFTDPVKFADGTSHVTGAQGEIPVDSTARASGALQGRRIADVARTLKAGRAATA